VAETGLGAAGLRTEAVAANALLASTRSIVASPTPGRRRLALPALVLAAACAAEPAPEPPDVRFIDVTAAAGLTRRSPTYDAVVADFDGDGAIDLYVGNHGAGAVLLRNRGDGTFEDVLPASGIDQDGDQHGAGAGDFDHDGDPDLYVSLGAGRGLVEKANRLYRNEGGLRFREVAAVSGATDPRGRSRAVAWLDYDRDGALDLLLANYATPTRLLRNREGAFVDVTTDVGITGDGHHIAWSDIDADGFPDVAVATSEGLKLFRNEGGKRFVEHTAAAGLQPFVNRANAIAFGDFDRDGAVDLYLGAGTAFQDAVVESDDELRFGFFAGDDPRGFDFTAVGAEPSFALFHNGTAVEAAGVHCGAAAATGGPALRCPSDAAAHDGQPAGDGFALWRDRDDPKRWHLRWSGAGDHHLSGIVRGARAPAPVGLRARLAGGGALLRNDGRGHFTAVPARPLADGANVLAATWADVDGDGWLDLYVVDGGVEGAGGRNRLYANVEAGDGERALLRLPDETGATPARGGERGAAAHFFDYDRDGGLDVLLLEGAAVPPFDQGPYRLLHNESPRRHFLSLQLSGDASNRDGLGAWVEVAACERKWRAFHDGGMGPTSQSAAPLHFGLGDCGAPAQVTIDWPSGVRQVIQDVAIDREVRVAEPARDAG
jgi:hypothetical protein